MATKNQNGTLFSKTVCLSVTFRSPGSKRNGNMDGIETDAEKTELILSKKIFDSEHFRKTHTINLVTRRWIEARAVPSPLRGGTYLIPNSLIDEVYARLDEATREYYEAANQFVEEYPDLIRQWKKKLGSQFRSTDYPPAEEMRRRFSVDRMVLKFDLANQETIDQSKEVAEAIEDIRSALRQGLLMLVDRLASMLQESEDGKRKRFSQSVLKKFNEWMELLPARLVVDDDKLQKLADQAKKLLEGKSVDDFKDNDKIRNDVRVGVEKISVQIKKLMKDRPVRSFGVDD